MLRDTVASWFSPDTPEPVHTGHRYENQITGERFEVYSVARRLTTIERLDADRRPAHKVETDELRRAIEAGFVVHDDGCPACKPEPVPQNQS